MNNILRLVYYLWVPQDFSEGVSYVYNLHMSCLNHYFNLFDEVIVVLGCDNVDDKTSISKIENDFLSMKPRGDISFKIVPNNPLLREATTLENEVIKKLNDLDGITFFGHGKGMCNITSGTIDGNEVNKESLYEWICALYYLSLEYVERVKKTLIADIRITYGSMLGYCESFWKKPSWQYNGSFFWLNTKKLYDHCKVNNIHIPQCTDRTYGETLLWKLLPFDFNYIESHDAWYVNTDVLPINPYTNSDAWIRAISPNNEYDAFMNFYQKMKEEAHERTL